MLSDTGQIGVEIHALNDVNSLHREPYKAAT